MPSNGENLETLLARDGTLRWTLLRILNWQCLNGTPERLRAHTRFMGEPLGYFAYLVRWGFLHRTEEGWFYLSPRYPGLAEALLGWRARTDFRQFLRDNADAAEVLRRAWIVQIIDRVPRWDAFDRAIRIVPWFLDRLVTFGFLRKYPGHHYAIDEENPRLMEHLSLYLQQDLPAIREAQAHRARQEAAREAAAARERERIAREQERRQQEAEARKLRLEECQRIWEHGTPREVAALFGTGDEAIEQLLLRGFPRRVIVADMHVGEHRVSRILRRLQEAGRLPKGRARSRRPSKAGPALGRRRGSHG